jgi:hypothetical protein
MFALSRLVAPRAPRLRAAARGAGGVAVLVAVVALVAPAVAGPATGTQLGVRAVHPGPIGHTIVVTSQVSFDGDNRAYDLASDAAGRTYLAWISAKANASDRRIYFCKLAATGCQGPAQSTVSPDTNASAPNGLRLLVSPSGEATVLWYADEATGGHVVAATSDRGGPLSAGANVVSAASQGSLLDAEIGPDGQIWTVVWPRSPATVLQVRDGLSGPATTIKLVYEPGYASLAFAKSTPIVAVTVDGAITRPVAWSVKRGATWSKLANVKGTWSSGTNVGLTATKSGVRLTTGDGGSRAYAAVVSKWTGHGFSPIKFTGDHNACPPASHDTGTDASGRLTDVTNECGKITVSNLADTTHAGVVRFATGGVPAGGAPQIATLPRGYAWVAWSVQFSSDTTRGDTLKLTRLLLPGVVRHVSKRTGGGSATVSGPVSCMPNSGLKVGVAGHPARGWHIAKRTLTLNNKRQGATLNGAALTPGRAYTLTGKVVFAKGHRHATAEARLKFKACPNP